MTITIKNEKGNMTYTLKKSSIAYMYIEETEPYGGGKITYYQIVLQGNDKDNKIYVNEETYKQVKEWLNNEK